MVVQSFVGYRHGSWHCLLHKTKGSSPHYCALTPIVCCYSCRGIAHPPHRKTRHNTPPTRQSNYHYINKNGENEKLPFTILLNKFSVSYHAGNMAAMDYASNVTIVKDNKRSQQNISMNNIYTGAGVRLYQSSFDEDMKGSYLSVNSDPYGIPVTYTGYALLFFALVAMLVEPKGNFRRLLRNNVAKGTVSILLLLFSAAANAQTTLPKATANQFGKLLIVYNGRICPIETYAIDFTKKLYGKASYKGFTPCQILTGFLFWQKEWMGEPILQIRVEKCEQKCT